MLDKKGTRVHTTHRQTCNTYCFASATMVSRNLLDVTLYVHCLSCHIPECFTLKVHFRQNLKSREELSMRFSSTLLRNVGTFISENVRVKLSLISTYLLSDSVRQQVLCCVSTHGQLQACCYLRDSARCTEETDALLIFLPVFSTPPLIPASTGSACLYCMLMAALTI
jgi:hypothetical protein